MRKLSLLCGFLSVLTIIGQAQILNLPPRPEQAPKGRAFAEQVWSVSREERENVIFNQIKMGNVPEFLRRLVPIRVTASSGSGIDTLIYYVTPDYLAIGADDDYFLMPMTPLLAQKIADSVGCSLPTKKMVDDIYLQATVKLRPQPIAPSAAMITVPVFAQHNDSVWSLRSMLLPSHPLGELVGGTKKDVIISNKIYRDLKPTVPKPVVIYGWHQLNGLPIQPVYNGHEETYADYSHGIRLVQNQVWLNGQPTTIKAILQDANRNILLSDEGIISVPRYNYPVPQAPVPKTFGVRRNDDHSIRLIINPEPGINYTVYYGTDGLQFPDSCPVHAPDLLITNLQTDQPYYFRLRASQEGLVSAYSEVLAAVPSSEPNPVLIVNGFDRATSSNTYNFIRQHGRAFFANGYAFDSATNEAVLQGINNLDGYPIVDYVLGEESTVDETLSLSEQELIKSYLQNGGSLLISGSEIAWDLDYKGSTTDREFYRQYLKAAFVLDAPNNAAGLYYRTVPVAGSLFEGLGNLYFDNGTHGCYNVKYPDVIEGANGGVNCLQYGSLPNQFAGVAFSGSFPNGAKPGKLVNLGVPLEAFYPDSTRAKIVRRIVNFFDQAALVEEKPASPEDWLLAQNFPNPFNTFTVIPFRLPHTELIRLTIFDLSGRLTAELLNTSLPAGSYQVTYDANRLPSGQYFYQLWTPQGTQTRKMQIIK